MENHQEDILKKFLQDTFSDYEPEPSDSSWSTIFSTIQPHQPTFWGKSKPWIASVLVVLTGVWMWYGSPKVEANNLEIAFNSNQSAGTIALDKTKILDDSQTAETPQLGNKITIVSKQSDDSQMAETPQLGNKIAIVSKQSDNNQTAQAIKKQNITLLKHIPEPKKESLITKYSNEIIVKNNTPKEEVENHPIVEKRSDEVVALTDNLTASMSGRMKAMALKLTVENTETQFQTVAAGNERVETFATDINPTTEQVRYIRPMQILHNKDFTLTKIALNSPVILPLITPNREAKPVRQHTYLSMSITPIQTYRILTINNNSVQNVQTSNLFDSERNGWQFDLGMIKPIGKLWNFRTNISYLRMRQWSDYKIGTNELVLRNTNYSNSAQSAPTALEVVGQTVTESKNLHMVGLKIDVQKFFKITAKNRYFISTGTQLMYENSQKQSNIFLNVSAGFQHVVSQTTFLTIEPIASYGLNNFNDSKSLLQANGYNLGLKMGVSFRVK